MGGDRDSMRIHVWDIPTMRDYMHVHTILVFLLRLAILASPERGHAHYMLDTLAIPHRHLTVQRGLGHV
eukprot:5653079-Pyramimonas_sp.AAC.1